MQRPFIHNTPLGTVVGVLVLALLVGYGGYLRIYHLGASSLWIDEGFSINAAQAILAHGTPLLDSGEQYDDWLLPDYLIAGSMYVFGFDPFSPASARLPSAILGTLLIAAVFALAYSLFKKYPIAFAAAFLTTFSQWGIAWSGQARGYAGLALCMVALAWCAWRFFESRRYLPALAGVLVAVAAYYSNPLSLLVLPALGLFFASDAVVRWRIRERLGGWRFVLLCGLFFVASVAFFEEAVRWTRLVPYAASGQYLRFMFEDMRAFSLGALLGTGVSFFDEERFRPAVFLALCLSVPALFITAYSPLANARYFFAFFPFALILCAYAAWFLCDRFLALLASRLPVTHVQKERLVGPLVCALALLVVLPHLQFAPRDSRPLETGSPQPDFAAAYALIRDTKTADDVVISPYADLSKIYLGGRGLWLVMSLTGKPSELARYRELGVDYYTGAPGVEFEALETALDTQHGFVVLDRMAAGRLPSVSRLMAEDPHVREVLRSGAGIDEIRVYRFGEPGNTTASR